EPMHGMEYRITLDVPPMSVMFLKPKDMRTPPGILAKRKAAEEAEKAKEAEAAEQDAPAEPCQEAKPAEEKAEKAAE
ncbi:MAG: 1,4-alpha-glucan branching enzyme, partial [Oscillospiraceae bacterium]